VIEPVHRVWKLLRRIRHRRECRLRLNPEQPAPVEK
jgi:hypothetical protein